jgi:hypothetical protein
MPEPIALVASPRMSLPGPSRRITVEPIEVPASPPAQPVPSEAPAVPAPEPVPAR